MCLFILVILHQSPARDAQQGMGVHGSYISTPWTTAYPVPANVSIREAAAGLVQGLTALTIMTEAYPVKSGDVVFVHTIAGGLGLLLTQYAKSLGAKVVGTTSTKEKAEEAKKNGADCVILYKSEDTVQRVLEFTNGEGVDVIYDGVGKDTYVHARFRVKVLIVRG
jgi:NADPH:quinone reductase